MSTTRTLTVHDVADVLVEAMNDDDTPAWSFHDALSERGVDQHASDDYCHAYVEIGGVTFSLTVQTVDR